MDGLATTGAAAVDARFANIDARFTNTDKELHEIRGQMFAFGTQMSHVAAGQEAIAKQLTEMSTVQNRPVPKTNWWAVIGGVGVLLGMIASYFAVTLRPVEGDLQDLEYSQRNIIMEMSVRGEKIAGFEQWLIDHDKIFDERTQDFKAAERAIVELQVRSNAAEQAHNALAEEVRVVDFYGSRKWMNNDGPVQ